MQLMEHQLDAITKLANGKILYGGVGSGKSLVAMGYYIAREAPKDVYVITTAKKRDSLDWMRDGAIYGVGMTADSTTAGVLHIDSWNNIGNYTDLEDCFVIFDEQRVVGSGAWVKSFIKIAKKNRWILLSATPGDTWMDYIPVFVANGLYKNATEFKREHVVYAPYSRYPKIVRYTNVSTLEKYRNMLLVEMPYVKHTTRVIEDVICDYDSALFKKATVERWNPYTDKPIQDVGELFRVMRKIVNSDPSRLQKIRELLETHPRLVVFYNFDYELEILRDLSSTISVAEWNGHKHQPIPTTEKWVYLTQYVSGAEGWNCVETDAMVFYSLTYSYKNFEQAQGRIDRLNTTFEILHYFLLNSNSIIDKAIKTSLKEKRMFNQVVWASEHLKF